jgi:chemotaxis response regulator CheB
MKTQVAQRVVVMGLEGIARDQLVNALSEHGVIPIWVGRPLQSNSEQLSILNPNKIIVSLEPSIEPDLEAYSDLLSRPMVTVLYDDAETTRALSGWDLNRWARHMAAKLLNKDLLPQHAIEHSNLIEEQHLANHSLNMDFEYTEQNTITADEINDSSFSLEAESHSAWQDNEHLETLDIDSKQLNAALELLNAQLLSGFQTQQQELSRNNFENQADTYSFTSGTEFVDNVNSHFISTPSNIDIELAHELGNGVEENLGKPAHSFDNNLYSENEMSLVSSPVISEEPPVGSITKTTKLELSIQQEADYENIHQELSNLANDIPIFNLEKYTLLDINAGNEQCAVDVVVQSKVSQSNSLKPLMLVISGLGGPAALRSMLEKIKTNYTGLLIICHDIHSVQLPSLRDQLQKVTHIPLQIPDTDEFLKNGNIYLLKKQQTIHNTSLGYQCISGLSLSGFILKMDSDVGLVILSGADALLSESLVQISSTLNNIHVQSPSECFEPSLAKLLVDIGVPLLSNEVLEQWFN